VAPPSISAFVARGRWLHAGDFLLEDENHEIVVELRVELS
jgi:hypothetical protein